MQIVPFLIVILIAMLVPGPNILLAMNSARVNGLRETRPLMAGISVGFAFVIFLACALNLYLARIMPAIRPYLGAIGATYILWLALQPFLPRKKKRAAAQAGDKKFLTGVVLQFINPKIIINSILVMATFILPHYDSLSVFCFVAFLCGSLCFITLHCWA